MNIQTKVAHYALSISNKSLLDLVKNDISAIRLTNFVPEQARQKSINAIRRLTKSTTYMWSDDFSVIGTSVGEAHENAAKERAYFEGVAGTEAVLREEVFPTGSPVQQVAQLVAAAWPAGVVRAQLRGQAFLSEIVRHWMAGGSAHPHIDQVNTHLLRHLGLQKRIGCNAYLEMPETGGAVQFWDKKFTDEEYLAAKRPDYGLDREFLGLPTLKVTPQAPEVVLFDASLPHAVEPLGMAGERIVNAAFFGFAGFDKPLVQFA